MKLPFGWGQGALNDALAGVGGPEYDEKKTTAEMKKPLWRKGSKFVYTGPPQQGICKGAQGLLTMDLMNSTQLALIEFDGVFEPALVRMSDLQPVAGGYA